MEKLFLLKFAVYDRSDIETNENIFPVEIYFTKLMIS